ncbi:DUF4352 domain-containing protein [Thalassobacillus pellis]|uniref:DUF4352 domain-containing protein n=1 Tax=Thalassobacillus pellis TaxID=748008 RepID=UPI00195FFF72|nr:DUF4352 domain-containing protein [Thalassobacillus pellis]MBM7552157.1 major membrane immunogen (membrane-anchored lipoprotein) [Thalassobacillus pellis]
MKHILLLVTALVLLTACSNNEKANGSTEETKDDSEQTEETKETKETEEQTATEKDEPDTFIESPQAPDDSELTEIGQTHRDKDGKIELLAYAPEDKTLQAGKMEVTIKGAKVLNYRPSPDLIDFFHGYTNHEKNFNYLKVRVIVKNTSEEKVNFAPVSHIETNTGEKKSFKDDFYIENLHGDYQPGEVRKGQLGFILKETKPEELNKVTIYTSDVFQDKESIADAKSITISFN